MHTCEYFVNSIIFLDFLKFSVDKTKTMWYNIQAFGERKDPWAENGGIAQLARATGSYPVGHGFKSNSRYHKTQNADQCIRILWIRPVGQAVKTRPFHGCNMGSIPVRVTIEKRTPFSRCPFFLCYPYPISNTLEAPGDSNMGSKHCSAASVSEAL